MFTFSQGRNQNSFWTPVKFWPFGFRRKPWKENTRSPLVLQAASIWWNWERIIGPKGLVITLNAVWNKPTSSPPLLRSALHGAAYSLTSSHTSLVNPRVHASDGMTAFTSPDEHVSPLQDLLFSFLKEDIWWSSHSFSWICLRTPHGSCWWRVDVLPPLHVENTFFFRFWGVSS